MTNSNIFKFQYGGYTTKSDNTRVYKNPPLKFKLTQDQKNRIRQRELQKASKKNWAYIYDTKKAQYYKNLQDFYNNNFFGYGVVGNQTRIDYSTPEGQQKIQSNYNYAKNNVKNFSENLILTGTSGITSRAVGKGVRLYDKFTKGAFRSAKNGNLGSIKKYTKNGIIGSGSEAIVVKNTPITVGKITTIPKKEMALKNSIPNTVQSQYVGFVKDKGSKLPTYIQQKVSTITEEKFPKYISKLDKAMQKAGFRKVNDPNVQYRAYTNGKLVVDDISPDNIGLTFFRKPKMIDFNIQTVPEWIAQGFTLRNGGKLPY